jgi:type IV secretory pathway VirB10-like protein
MSADYTHLSTTDLAKAINDEYSVILGNERANLQKALAVGEKLKALRPRVTNKHGEWQAKLKVHCPTISYETATLYVRLWDKREDLETKATERGVTVTDLTIQEARKLLAKPKQTKPTPPAPTPNPSAVKAAIEPANERSDEDVAKDWLKVLAADELVAVLKQVRDTEYLRELSEALSKVLPKIDPLAIPPALQRTPAAAPGFRPRV